MTFVCVAMGSLLEPETIYASLLGSELIRLFAKAVCQSHRK